MFDVEKVHLVKREVLRFSLSLSFTYDLIRIWNCRSSPDTSRATVIGIFASNSWSIVVIRYWFDAVSNTNKLSVVKILKNSPKIDRDIKNHRSGRWLPRKPARESMNEAEYSWGTSVLSMRPATNRCRSSTNFRSAYRMSDAMNIILNHCKIGDSEFRAASFFNGPGLKTMKMMSSKRCERSG